jgi:hypothetical protein
MRIAIFWTDVTANMAACWRALASRPGVAVKVFVAVSRQPDTAYRPAEILAGLDHRLIDAGAPSSASHVCPLKYDRTSSTLAPQARVHTTGNPAATACRSRCGWA